MDVLILAGGEARRLGGADKPMVEIGGLTLLDRVIAACIAATHSIGAMHSAPPHGDESTEPASAHVARADSVAENQFKSDNVIVVGPPRLIQHSVRWVREDPPGGGPVTAIAAGLSVCRAPYVGIFAADLPFLSAETVHRLWTTLAESGTRYDGAVVVDADGREQWLAAVYRREALAARIADQEAAGLHGLPLRRVVHDLRLLRITAAGQTALDCDTWEDVAAARRIAALRPVGPTPQNPGDERD